MAQILDWAPARANCEVCGQSGLVYVKYSDDAGNVSEHNWCAADAQNVLLGNSEFIVAAIITLCAAVLALQVKS